MGAVVKDLLRAFQELAEPDKHELASAILRWEASADHSALTDEELLVGADAVFLGLEKDEGSRA